MKKHLLPLLFFMAITLPALAQWDSTGTQISFLHTGNSHRPFLSAAANGAFYATWETTDTGAGALVSVWLNAFSATGAVLPGWATGGIKVSDTSDNYAPQIITSEDGNVIIAWCSFPHGAINRGNIYVQKYSHSGAALWNNGIPLQVNPDSANVNEYPELASDKHNGVYIAWNRFDLAIDFNSQNVMLQHIDSTGSIANGWNAAGTGVAVQPGFPQFDPQIVVTPDGLSIYVAYDTGFIGANALMLNRFNTANGTLVSGWNSAGFRVYAGPYLNLTINSSLRLFTDSLNDAVLVWMGGDQVLNWELLMQTISPNRTNLLHGNGQLLYGDLTPYAGGEGQGLDYMQAVQDSDQSLLITYGNLDSVNTLAVSGYDLGAMRVKTDGTIIWSDTLLTTDGSSAYPNPVSDGKRGMFIFYNHVINQTQYMDVVEVDSTGALDSTWTLPGVVFNTLASFDPHNPNYDFGPVATRRGEAVVAWTNGDSASYYQLYVCNILANKEKCITNAAYPDTISASVKNITASNVAVNVFPNPGHDNITVNFVSDENYNRLTFSLFDVEGNLVLETSIAELSDNQISTALLSQGLYIYRISGNNIALGTGKLIKQ